MIDRQFNCVRAKTLKAMLRFKRRMAGVPDSSRARNANYDPTGIRRGKMYWSETAVPLSQELSVFADQEQHRIDGIVGGRPDETWGRWRHGSGLVRKSDRYLGLMKSKKQLEPTGPVGQPVAAVA